MKTFLALVCFQNRIHLPWEVEPPPQEGCHQRLWVRVPALGRVEMKEQCRQFMIQIWVQERVWPAIIWFTSDPAVFRLD